MYEISAHIEAPEEEADKMKNVIAEPIYRSDKQIEDEFEARAVKIGTMLAKQFQMPGMVQIRKPPFAIVVFVLQEEQFNAMGRPTVGDFLPVEVYTEKYRETHEDTYTGPSPQP